MALSLLVLEDDPMVRRFLGMACERLGVQAHLCASIAQANAALGQGAFDAILTDLRLADGDGLDFVASLAPYREQHPHCQILVSSGAMDENARARLQALGVHHLLPKPLELATLQQLLGGMSAPKPAAVPTESDRRQHAIESHFGGNERMFRHYETLCMAQFPADVAQADDALQREDWIALQHSGHNLKTVLRLLGWDGASALAGALEEAATQDTAEARRLWGQLSEQLGQLMAQGHEVPAAQRPQ